MSMRLMVVVRASALRVSQMTTTLVYKYIFLIIYHDTRGDRLFRIGTKKERKLKEMKNFQCISRKPGVDQMFKK